ncbi:MAG: tripartite tricarboxylate transporter substrate binding protein [Betaproteobacteria bacterium]|nr:tripartite tricarboxylate transporter substrate binding protein [Betaproteobacteria bacterium]
MHIGRPLRTQSSKQFPTTRRPEVTLPLSRSIARLFALGALVLCANAGSQTYPNRPLRIVTSEAGGGIDFSARMIAQGLTTLLGQQVVVDNRGGATISSQTVAKALPDGYTLLVHNNSLWTFPLLQQNAPYDAVKDFLPVTLATRSPNILVVNPALPVNSVADLIALAKARPGELNYGSGPTGASNHLAGELFKAMAGVNLARISYKGGATALNDLISGQVQVMFATTGSVMQHVKSGRLKALGVTGLEPSPLAPGLPAVAASVPGYESLTLYGLFAPAQTPAALIHLLHQTVAKFLARPDTTERLFNSGVETVGSTPQEFAAAIRIDTLRLAKVVKSAGPRID